MLSLASNQLLETIRQGNLSRVEEMVREDPSLIHTKTQSGATLVLYALYTAQKGIAEFLAAEKGELDIYEASSLGRLERVKELVHQNPILSTGTRPMASTLWSWPRTSVRQRSSST